MLKLTKLDDELLRASFPSFSLKRNEGGFSIVSRGTGTCLSLGLSLLHMTPRVHFCIWRLPCAFFSMSVLETKAQHPDSAHAPQPAQTSFPGSLHCVPPGKYGAIALYLSLI